MFFDERAEEWPGYKQFAGDALHEGTTDPPRHSLCRAASWPCANRDGVLPESVSRAAALLKGPTDTDGQNNDPTKLPMYTQNQALITFPQVDLF
jgi:hypothetical protein